MSSTGVYSTADELRAVISPSFLTLRSVRPFESAEKLLILRLISGDTEPISGLGAIICKKKKLRK